MEQTTTATKSTSKYEILSDINSNTGNVSIPDDLDDLINMTSVVSPPVQFIYLYVILA